VILGEVIWRQASRLLIPGARPFVLPHEPLIWECWGDNTVSTTMVAGAQQVTTGVLVNVAGFLLGGVLYGLLLAMAARSHPTTGTAYAAEHRWREWLERPLVWAGALGLLWNLGAFLVYGFPALRTAPVVPPLMALSFAALGFLPAVVVQVVLTVTPRPRRRLEVATIAAAYVLSATAAVLQVAAWLADQPLPSRLALSTLTLGFLALLWPLVAMTRRAREGRTVWIVALALFGVSALHLIRHTGRDPWWIEALGHQGSLLLPVAILLRDYRFAFADLFLKRALALSLTVGLVLATHLLLHGWNGALGSTDASVVAYLLALAVMTALVQRRFQAAATWLVDTVVLRRVNYEQVLQTLEQGLAPVTDEDRILEHAGLRIAKALGANYVETVRASKDVGSARPMLFVDGDVALAPVDTPSAAAESLEPREFSAVVTIPTVESPRLAWRLGRLAGARRWLSDDLRLLESAASLVGRRVDALRVGRERVSVAIREQEMARLATEAELRALRAQIDPHFLFNALTTIGYLIRASPRGAEATLVRLTSLLRAVLRRARLEFTTLGEELELVEAYLEIERARFEERLRVTIDVPPALRALRIPSLLIQPLVENAVKHGVAPLAAGGDVSVRARRVSAGQGAQLRIVVHDTGVASSPADWAYGRQHGVGLANIEARLRCHFGARASFDIDIGAPGGTTVALVLPLESLGETLQRTEVVH
jgi:two-component system LytT family sensor kinase